MSTFPLKRFIRQTTRTALNSTIAATIFVMGIVGCSDNSDDPVTGEGVFQTQSESAIIEGELFLPDGEGPFPSMIIVAGSGSEPRQELEAFVPLLNGNGYALYLFDKRGVGGSTGSYPVETISNQTEFLTARAQDVIGIMDLLISHDQIDNDRIGVLGSSQGAWVNSLVHSLRDDLSYIIMASGGVASVGLEGFYCQLTDNEEVSIEEAIEALNDFSGEAGFDPLPIIETMSLPVLWLYGNEDRSHPTRYDVAVLQELNRPNFTVQLFQNTNHELIDLDSGLPPTDLNEIIGQWLEENN